MYGSESWVTTREQKKKIVSTQKRFVRKIEGKTIIGIIIIIKEVSTANSKAKSIQAAYS